MYKTFTVYILLCVDGSYYTGMTTNSEQRMAEHHWGKYPDSYTYGRRPVKLVWHHAFTNDTDAILWEKRIQGWSRKKKEALIKGDWGFMQHLAKRQKTYKKRVRLSYKRRNDDFFELFVLRDGFPSLFGGKKEQGSRKKKSSHRSSAPKERGVSSSA
jgi:putative endonuclease